MKCPECIEENERSQVYPGGSSSTLMGYQPFYDEDGILHDHNPNIITTGFTCSRGHSWAERRKSSCPNCEYGHD